MAGQATQVLGVRPLMGHRRLHPRQQKAFRLRSRTLQQHIRSQFPRGALWLTLTGEVKSSPWLRTHPSEAGKQVEVIG